MQKLFKPLLATESPNYVRAIDVDTVIATDIGRRKEQQDAAAHFLLHRGHASLAVVADGMGGFGGGGLASQLLVEACAQFAREYAYQKVSNPYNMLQQIMKAAHHAMHDAATDHSFRPHATCALLYLDQNCAHWAHIGDCRVYQWNGASIKHTKDHSIVQKLFDEGKIRADEMAKHPEQHKVLRALGMKVDIPKFDYGCCHSTNGFTFLLCSDGFWGNLSHDEVSSLMQAADLKKSLSERILLAKSQADAHCDNITALLCRSVADDDDDDDDNEVISIVPN
ncbi:MAG: protein phosphatase 2C domain-containing protein [Mariprofundaceae bacterium]|nr:protein phosphatase 2C domain-containing protein [Mariprofundaceae bacterium]